MEFFKIQTRPCWGTLYQCRSLSFIEKAMGKKAIKKMYPMQQGDVPRTFANVDELIKDYKYSPSTNIKTGIQSFVKWFKDYKKTK